MKILHILDHSLPLHSGYAFRTIAILQAQRALGWQTAHLTTPKHKSAKQPIEIAEDWTFYRTQPLSLYTSRVPVLRELATIQATARRIIEVARSERPDILHAHSPALNGLAALQAGRKLGLPVVYELRGIWEDAAVDHGTTNANSIRYRLSRALETHVLKRSDAVTTICDHLRQELMERGISSEKITIIPNAVDPREFSFGRATDENLRRRLGLDGKTVFGFIGSWYAYEGLDLLISALPAVLKERRDVALLLVGGGPMEERLSEASEALGLNGAIRFVGRVPHNEVMRYYDLVDVFVYPRHSMRLTELVTPLKPLEAMARGRVVLASNVGGHRELIRANETGFLCPADDRDILADAMLQVLACREKWPEIQRAARRFVENERTWDRSVQAYRGVYGRVLSKEELAPWAA